MVLESLGSMNFTLRITRLNPPQVCYWLGFSRLSYRSVLYISALFCMI